MHAERVHVRPIDPTLQESEYYLAGDSFRLFFLASGRAFRSEPEVNTGHPAPYAFWVAPGRETRIRLAAGSRGYLLEAPLSRLQSALPAGQAAAFVQRAVATSSGFILDEHPILEHVRALMSLLAQNTPPGDPLVDETAQHGLALLLCTLLKARAKRENETAILPRRVVQEFARLVELHLNDHWTVKRYAGEIGVTRDHLQHAVRRHAGRSPLEYIHARMTETACSLLIASDLTVAEIAYRLGFSDAAYFNRFFKRRAGISPGVFRKSRAHASKWTLPSSEFSAWP